MELGDNKFSTLRPASLEATTAAVSPSTEIGNFSATTEEDYVYDYDASLATLPVTLIPVTLIYTLTLILGVVGNALVIFSIAKYRKMQSVTNIFLTSLASADMLLVLICVPVKLIKWYSFTWNFGEVVCKLVHYLQNVSVICSIMTLTVMSMERYVAILHPLKVKYISTAKRARRVIIAIWVLSVILAVPIIFGQIHKLMVGVRRSGYWCLKEWSRPIYAQLYETSMLCFIFIIPLIVMTFAYASICNELWRMTFKRANMVASNSARAAEYEQESTFVNSGKDNRNGIITRKRKPPQDDKMKKQVIKMLIAIIVIFAICWGPYLIDNVLVAFGLVEQLNYEHLKPMRQAFVIMAYFNSCVNPIVYAFMSKNFRESFKKSVSMCCTKRSPNSGYSRYGMGTSFQTRTTSMTFSRGHSTRADMDTRIVSDSYGDPVV